MRALGLLVLRWIGIVAVALLTALLAIGIISLVMLILNKIGVK